MPYSREDARRTGLIFGIVGLALFIVGIVFLFENMDDLPKHASWLQILRAMDGLALAWVAGTAVLTVAGFAFCRGRNWGRGLLSALGWIVVLSTSAYTGWHSGYLSGVRKMVARGWFFLGLETVLLWLPLVACACYMVAFTSRPASRAACRAKAGAPCAWPWYLMITLATALFVAMFVSGWRQNI